MREASRAHSSSPGRDADRTSISGSLPSEIRQLSSLTRLYGLLSAVFWALRQERAPYKLCTKGTIGAHFLVQVCLRDKHLRVDPNRDRAAELTYATVQSPLCYLSRTLEVLRR